MKERQVVTGKDGKVGYKGKAWKGVQTKVKEDGGTNHMDFPKYLTKRLYKAPKGVGNSI
jgi:hypothetical protein